jgi:hypothetical protein
MRFQYSPACALRQFTSAANTTESDTSETGGVFKLGKRGGAHAFAESVSLI